MDVRYLSVLCLSLVSALCAPLAMAQDTEGTPDAITKEETASPVAVTSAVDGPAEGLPQDFPLGDPDAPVTVIEYASLSCSHCATFANTVYPEFKKQYIDTGNVRFVFRNFIRNQPDLHGSMLMQCAGAEKFHTFGKVLFASQAKWAFSPKYLSNLATTAKLGGLSQEAFDACMQDQELQESLIAGTKYAAETYEVTSTPTFIINGEKYPGVLSIKRLQSIIDPLLAANPVPEDEGTPADDGAAPSE